MSQMEDALGPALVTRAISSIAAVASQHVRITVVLALALICGSLASAGILQLRWEHGEALATAKRLERHRASEIASDVATLFGRYGALGLAFADASGAESSGALSDAGGPALTNVVVLAANGSVLAQMKGRPGRWLPLPANILANARAERQILTANSRHLVLLQPHGTRIVAVEIDLSTELTEASMEDAVLARPDGQTLALGTGWQDMPEPAELALTNSQSAARTMTDGQQRRLVALQKVPGWPIVAGASISTGAALSSWYASLPLFFFFIFGPAISGAGLALVFVREFERRARAADRIRAFKARGSSEAKLLVRLADAERRAGEAERSKSEFVAHMSHELRTPLNAVIGFSEIIAGGYFGDPGHPKYVEYARDITRAGKLLHDKIADVLEFANLEAGRHPIMLAPVDLASVARDVVDEWAGRAFSRRIHLTISLPDVGPVRGDRAAIKRVLSNLLSNALEYTPERGAVRVSTRLADGSAVVSISDTGQGFTAAEQAVAGRAFTRFDRPGAVTGIGMGLAIAMALTRAMGGVLRLAGSPGHGTTAELRLLLL